MEQCFGVLEVEMIAGKHWDFSNFLAKGARAQSGAFADVQFPDYGTELWPLAVENGSKAAMRFQHLSRQESESSVWSMCRGAVS
jgi:hypothetical protein